VSDPRYGLDTGFFSRLFEGTERARSVWTTIVEGRADGVVSAASVYELQRNALNGVLVRDDVEVFLDELPVLATIYDTLSREKAQRAAHLGGGTEMPMADALILQAFLDEEVTHIFTTDHDFTAYEGEPEVEVIRRSVAVDCTRSAGSDRIVRTDADRLTRSRISRTYGIARLSTGHD